jgi:hypothetical protein
VTIAITGSLLPLRDGASFSAFLSDYLGGKAHRLSLATPLYPSFSAPAEFPAPHPKPQVLREVAMRDMHARLLSNGQMVASGSVYTKIVLPKGINIGMDVRKVLPDVLIFDGPVPAGAGLDAATLPWPGRRKHRPQPGETPPPKGSDGKRGNGGKGTEPDDEDPPLPDPIPLPDPLPPRAFGHILPDDWLDAQSVPLDDDEQEDGQGTAIAVTSHFTDVPLQVLPGREREFRDFVSKVRRMVSLSHFALWRCAYFDILRLYLARVGRSLGSWVM